MKNHINMLLLKVQKPKLPLFALKQEKVFFECCSKLFYYDKIHIHKLFFKPLFIGIKTYLVVLKEKD